MVPTPQSTPKAAAPGEQAPRFTACQLGAALGISSKAVRKRMRLIPGPAGGGWEWQKLPDDWRATIVAASTRKGYKSPEELLSDRTAGPWMPAVPFAEVPEHFRQKAVQWRNALLPVLQIQHTIPPGEVAAKAFAECRRVFGRVVSESTWRRHFDLAVKRDNGFEQWARVDIFLAEEAFQKSGASADPGEGGEDANERLTDVFNQVDNPSDLTLQDRDFIWRALVASSESTKPLLDYAFKALPGLAKTRAGLDRTFFRKKKQPVDKRPGRSGRKGKSLCPDCESMVAGAAVQLDGDLAQAWRRLQPNHGLGSISGEKLCQKCAILWHFDVRSNKSYVPLAVRNQVEPTILQALPFRHGPAHARLLSPYVNRLRDIGPGDVFEGDDVTFNHIFYVWCTDDEGQPYVGRGECVLFIDRGSFYPVGYRLIAGEVGVDGKQVAARYNGVDIRLAVLHIHDRVGLPHKGFQFENGVWKSRLVAGEQRKGWIFNPWREVEQGLNQEGIWLEGSGRAVRHALPGNPRTKLIERVIRSVQERMRPVPGFVGFNHRDYKPEVLDDFARRVRSGKEHPGEMFLSLTAFRDTLDAELIDFANEVQNGKWLPGVSPREVWENGIGKFPGVSSKPLRQLPSTARHLLSTHWRHVDVTERGIIFKVGGRQLAFWGDELFRFKQKKIPVRWNIEEPDLLHCLPPGAPPFTMKAWEHNSYTATAEALSKSSAARNRWTRHSRAIFDKLPHPLISRVSRDSEHPETVHAEGGLIAADTENYRAAKLAEAENKQKMAAMGGALGIKVSDGRRITPRTIAARGRRIARAAATEEGKT